MMAVKLDSWFLEYVATAAGLVVLMMQVGCATSSRMTDPSAAVVPDRIYEPRTKSAEGSIWPGDSRSNLFFIDTKAMEVGDIVTVVIQETATSSQSATTNTAKNSSINLQTNAVLGMPTSFGIQNFMGLGGQFDPSVNASTARSNQGTGTTTRQGTLTATISVTIVEVLRSGNFRIEGSRSVTVNNEEQLMVLRGIIRPVDINFDNTISSRLVADASIIYTGEGVVADEQRVGWAMRILSLIWPF